LPRPTRPRHAGRVRRPEGGRDADRLPLGCYTNAFSPPSDGPQRMSRTPLALLLAAAGLTVAARPQSPAGFTAAESKAPALKEQGDLIAAGKELCAAIEAADLGDPANRALVESLAVQAFSLAHSTGAFASLRGTLQATRNRAADPCLRATLDLLDLEAALEIGDATSIGEATTRLGFLTAWWVIGPFDNERGGGFARAFPPESG